MAYNTLSDVYQGARFRTGTNTTDFGNSDANLLSLANKYYRKIVMALVQDNEDYYAKITTLALSNGGNPYSLSSDSSLGGGGENIQVLRVEVSYDNGTNWVVGSPLQYSEIATPTFKVTDITGNFSTSQPFYAVYANSIYFFPDATQTATSRIFEVTRQKELSASTDSFGASASSGVVVLPKEFMEIMEDYIVSDLYERLGKFEEARTTKSDTDIRLELIRMRFGRRVEDFDLSIKADTQDYAE